MTKDRVILLIYFFVPINWAFHFIFKWAYIKGLLIDYLIPSVHFLDIVIALLILYLIYRGVFLNNAWRQNKILISIAALLFFTFFSSSFLSLYPPSSIYLLSRYTLYFIFLILYLGSTKKYFSNKMASILVLIPLYFESALGIVQYIKQSSIFGYIFLGETTFNPSLPGILLDSLYGSVKVPPYGTFPHPNVLAFFLGFGVLLYLGNKKWSLKDIFAIAIPLIVLLLTQSLVSIVGLITSLVWGFLAKRITSKRILFTTIFLAMTVLVYFSFNLKLLERINILSDSVERRVLLNNASIAMVKQKPLYGFGLNTFTVFLEDKIASVGLRQRFVQPVHNIYLLSASESGIISAIFLLALLFYLLFAFRLSIFAFIIFVSFFDHYLLTLPQGNALFLLTVLLSASRIKKDSLGADRNNN